MNMWLRRLANGYQTLAVLLLNTLILLVAIEVADSLRQTQTYQLLAKVAAKTGLVLPSETAAPANEDTAPCHANP